MTSRTTSWAMLGGLVALGLGGAAAFYSGAGARGNSACAVSQAALARIAPLARDDVAAVEVRKSANPAPELAFNGTDGTPTTLAAFKGRTVLVNLWATWCPPCLHEMPSLDALQGALGGPDFAVVAINIDTRNLDKPRQWLEKKGIARLGYYADPQAGVFQSLRAAHKIEGMPVSLLVGADGCELAILQGPADWAGADAKALVTAAIARQR